MGAGRPAGLYDLYDCGEYKGCYTVAEIMAMLDIPNRTTVSHYSKQCALYKKRYLFEQIDDPVGKDQLKEWDRLRLRILLGNVKGR